MVHDAGDAHAAYDTFGNYATCDICDTSDAVKMMSKCLLIIHECQ